MKLTLTKLVVENFKGIRELSIEFTDTTNIYGANATGKTSIQDAFTWLLFNKDAEGNAPGSDNFREKPLDADGKEIHNLDTSVTAYFELDDAPFVLKRTQRESWVKKRGQSDAAFQGNISVYWINEVETKASDFKARVAGIATDEVFRLITSLGAFNAMDWRKRRAQLVAMSGAEVDTQLLATEEYAPIREEVVQRGIGVDDLRKVLSDQRKKVNTELQLIPARIDEAHKLRPDITERQRSDAEYHAADTQKDIAKIDVMIAEIENGGEAGGTRRQIIETEGEIIRIKREIASKYQLTASRLTQAAADATRAYENAVSAKSDAENRLKRANDEQQQAEAVLKKCRAEYSSVYEQAFVAPDSIASVCPTCGQSIPEEQYAQAVEKAQAEYESRKKASLQEITRRGNAAKKDCEVWTQRVNERAAESTQADERVKQAQAEMDAAQTAKSAMPAAPDYEENPRYAELTQQLADLRANVQDAPEEKIARLRERQEELREQNKRAASVLSQASLMVDIDKRIATLEQQQREYGDKVSRIEVLIGLCEKFVADRCNTLEATINDMFPTVRWKLFDVQINGGLVDICNCMIPCETGLVAYSCANTAAQVNADIEICGVLSKHYNVVAPLFLDNAERINYIASPAGQLITLSVSTDAELRVEHKSKEAA